MTWTTPGPLYTINLTPANDTIPSGGSDTYTATGADAFGTGLGNVNSQVTYGIGPTGNSSANVCTPGTGTSFTVTATGTNPVIGTVTRNDLAHRGLRHDASDHHGEQHLDDVREHAADAHGPCTRTGVQH